MNDHENATRQASRRPGTRDEPVLVGRSHSSAPVVRSSVQGVVALQRMIGNRATIAVLAKDSLVQRHKVTLSGNREHDLPDIDDSFQDEDDYVNFAVSSANWEYKSSVNEETLKLILGEVEEAAQEYWRSEQGEKEDSNDNSKNEILIEKIENKLEPTELFETLPLIQPQVKRMSVEEIMQLSQPYTSGKIRQKGNSMGKPSGEESLKSNIEKHESADISNLNGLLQEAIRLGVDIVFQQSFGNGNHRSAANIIYFFLAQNGVRLNCEVYKVHAILSHVRTSDDMGSDYKAADGRSDLFKLLFPLTAPLGETESQDYGLGIQKQLAGLPDFVGLMNKYRLMKDLNPHLKQQEKTNLLQIDSQIKAKLKEYVRLGGQFA